MIDTDTAALPCATVRHTGPRTDELPMAFTAWEFIRGALITYGLFLALTGALWIWLGIGAVIAIIYVAPFGFASLVLVGSPAAFATGMLLRRELRSGIHLFWHGLVGFVAGSAGVVFALCILGPGGSWLPLHWPDFSLLSGVWIIALLEALLTIGAAMAGWWITSRRALR